MGCCGGKKYIGNFIFKPIEIKLVKTGDEKLDKLFVDLEDCIKESEDIRQKIAVKFKDMIVSTGSCVLKHPTFERSLSTFLITILIEINKDVSTTANKIEEFDFKSLISVDSKPPFIHINEEKKKELKK